MGFLIFSIIFLIPGIYIVSDPFDYPEYLIFGYWRRILGWLFTFMGLFLLSKGFSIL